MPMLTSLQLPLPLLSEQQQIVTRIEKEQQLVSGNKQLIALYKQKIKDEINKLWQEQPVPQHTGKPKKYEIQDDTLSIAAEE